MPKGPCNHGAEMLEALDQPEKTAPPDLEEVIHKGQECFKKSEPKGFVLTVEHQLKIEKACLFFGGLFFGVYLGLALFC